MDLRTFLRCFFSPSLYSIHRGSSEIVGKYNPNEWERWGDNLVTSFVFFRALTLYTSPLLIFILARRGYFTIAGAMSVAKILISLGVIVGASYTIRSYGRCYSRKYQYFLDILDKASDNYDEQMKFKLKSFDFEFFGFPVDFENDASSDTKKPATVAKRSWYSQLSPCNLFTYIVMHTFGIRLIYPGSIQFLNYVLGPVLMQGRNRLVVNENGERLKVKTQDGNYIDTMFVDRRKDKSRNELGKILVICSEGNAGFYEIGIMATPLEAGYSVLGWNHPGFGGSSGMPYIDQEENAIDAVVQLALNKLAFDVKDIILFGWSIGGYATSWAALNYPEVRSVVVDASFDDLLPLAVPRMPALLEPVVKQTIRLQANLDIARKLCAYQGQILLVRRAADEIICTEPNDLVTNRGNNLLVKILRFRYPNLFDTDSNGALWEYLAHTADQQENILVRYGVISGQCKKILEDFAISQGLPFGENEKPYSLPFPLHIGENEDTNFKTQLLLYLASRYMTDFNATHCTTLPASMFQLNSHIH